MYIGVGQRTCKKIQTVPGPSLHNLSCACSLMSGWTRIAKFSWTQGVPAADEGLNLVMKSWQVFRRIRVFLRAQVSKLRTSSLILKKEKLLKTLEKISIYLLAILYVLRCTVFDKSCQNISCCSNLQLDLEFH